jgi:site-specific DNA-cytosine methylase
MFTPKLLELYSGRGVVSAAFRRKGFAAFEIDNRRRKGICEPTLRADMLSVRADDIIDVFGQPGVIWCSIPCTTFSYGAGNRHYFNGKPYSPQAAEALQLLVHTLELIADICPGLYFIENPVGHLRHNEFLQDWLIENGGVTKRITYSSYGADTIKPTNIFTNAVKWDPRPADKYGKGQKNPSGVSLTDIPLTQRQAVPDQLADELAEYCTKWLSAFHW